MEGFYCHPPFSRKHFPFFAPSFSSSGVLKAQELLVLKPQMKQRQSERRLIRFLVERSPPFERQGKCLQSETLQQNTLFECEAQTSPTICKDFVIALILVITSA